MSTAVLTCEKVYDYSHGLACSFRVWRAGDATALLQAHALRIEIEFGAGGVDENGSVFPMKMFEQVTPWLEHMFKGTVLVAASDPLIEAYKHLESMELLQLRQLPEVGMEYFATMIALKTESWLDALKSEDPGIKQRDPIVLRVTFRTQTLVAHWRRIG